MPTRLSDLFHRESFKKGADRSIELPRALVFDVTDLLIPAGTDWSGEGHPMGTIEPASWGTMIRYKFYLEVADPVQDELRLTVDDGPIYADSNTLVGARLRSTGSGGPTLWNAQPPQDVPTDLLVGQDGLSPTDSKNGSQVIGPVPETLYVGLHTSGVTTADITVVRARAAFLVI